jgi:hypothetical protein
MLQLLMKGECLNEVIAVPSIATLCLTRLYEMTNDNCYLAGVRACITYLEKFIIPENKWFDSETFHSCFPKPADFYGPFTSMYPQNNSSTFWTANAYLRSFEAAKDQMFLEKGKEILDYLSLTQQV